MAFWVISNEICFIFYFFLTSISNVCAQSTAGIDIKVKIPDRLPPGFQYPTTSTIPSTVTSTKSPTTTARPTTVTTSIPSTKATTPTTRRTTTTTRAPTESSTLHTTTVTPEPTSTSRKPTSTETPTNASNIQHILDHILSYDRRIRPNIFGKPVTVYCDFYISSIGPVDEVDMEFGMDIYFRMRWMDERFSFDPQYSPLVMPYMAIDYIWLPDIYFKNAKKGAFHSMIVPNKMAKIHANGTVQYSARMALTLDCPMTLLHYPMDFQQCFIEMGSYTYETADMILDWADKDPVEKDANFTLPQFEFGGYEVSSRTVTFKTGSYSALRVTFDLKRQIAFYMLQMYVPSTLIVILSWVSFWINKEAVPARITLGVTTVLTMTTQLASSRSASARVSYPKALDVWYAFCMILVFGVVIEFAIVNAMARTENQKQEKEKRRRESQKLLNGDTDDIERGTFEIEPMRRKPGSGCERLRQCLCITSTRIDSIARVFFPLIFAGFNVLYWSFYTKNISFGDLNIPAGYN